MKIVVKNNIKYETTDTGIITAIFGECPDNIVLGVTNIQNV